MFMGYVQKNRKIVLFLLLLDCFFAGCKKNGPTEPSDENWPLISSADVRSRIVLSGDNNARCMILDDPMLRIDSILVNKTRLTLDTIIPDLRYYSSSFGGVYPDSTYTLNVYHREGIASASVTAKGNISVILPDTNIVPRDSSDIVVSWHPVEGAGSYLFSYGFGCSYPGGARGYALGIVVQDTMYIISASDLLYMNYDTITSWSGEIGIVHMIVTRTSLDYSSGNIEGEGYGFWSAGCEVAHIELKLEGME
jgi:hypothetical protein